MSQTNKQTTSLANEASVASRTRRQTRIRARDEGDDEKLPAVQPSSHVSPAMRIYRHALESILGMLELDDLSRALAVSREWSAAVRSMAPILATVERSYHRAAFGAFPAVERIVGSPLLRHLSDIEITYSGRDNRNDAFCWTPLNNASLRLLAQHASNLTSFCCTLTLTPSEPLVLPAKLETLRLQLGRGYSDAEINDVLTAVASLPSLSDVHLSLFAFRRVNCVDLSLLAACPSLTDVELGTIVSNPPKISAAQVEQIRSTLGHLDRFSIGIMRHKQLARLLQEPIAAHWQDIGYVWADERSGGLLVRLQTLTKLDLYYNSDAADVDFLPQLPFLTDLGLHCDRPDGEWFIPADALLASLVRCDGLTELYLNCGFNSAHWSTLLTKLTELRTLGICKGALETLQCLATGPITESLEELTIEELNLPPSEVSHLYALRSLRFLALNRCFSSPLSDATINSLSPPSAILPALTMLRHSWRTAEDKLESVERKGPSFEWMQQRLTQ